MTEKLNQSKTSAKIEGKFYPLQHEEWLRACQELTPAQRDVLYYIRTLDPRNYGIEINAAEVARKLSSSERIVHRQTVSRALKELDLKGFIDLELLQVKAKVKPKGLWCDDAPQVCGDTQGVMTHPSGSPRTMLDHDAPCAIVTHHTKSETLVGQDPDCSKSIKEFKELKDSLSNMSKKEREDFKRFVKEEYKRTEGKEIRHINAFLQGEHFHEWYEKYQNRPEAVQATTNAKWENHPQKEEWLAEIERTKNPFEFAQTKEQQEFIKWCSETNQYTWLKQEVK